MKLPRLIVASCLVLGWSCLSFAAAPPAEKTTPDTSRGDAMIAQYFQSETAQLADRCLADINTLEDWTSRRMQYRQQLFEMLGLKPLPTRTDLKATITGKVDHESFTVENVHFQSRPGLYVTGNLYLPKQRRGRLPAILYVCGHGRVKKDGVSFGNKVHYQHHGAWFARNGYVCLTIDTLQLGEIEGIHHGTYGVRRDGGYHQQWWWNCRGYTSAGVEAWNCIRALDYLQTREEVDPDRIGVTGRSGGGAYSWWIAALDDRIKAAVPVAGITDLTNHVVNGCVEGHCDCMYTVNTYRWDYAQVAALVAPRPLLISNSDKDRIFPLDGVVRVHSLVKKIYDLYGKPEHLGLQITEGPHKDTQQLRVHAFHWFNRFLKGEDPLIETTAVKFFEPEQLKVFAENPSDELNTKIQHTFTKTADAPDPPESAAAWSQSRERLLKALKAKTFRGWPSKDAPLAVKKAFDVSRHGVRFAAYDFTSHEPIRLRLYLAHREGLEDFDLVVLNAVDEPRWTEFLATMRGGFADELAGETPGKPDAEAFKQTQGMFKAFKWAMAYVAPRGIGPTAFDPTERKQTQIRRRFMLLGQTLDGMRVYDVKRAAMALRSLPELKETQLWMQGHRSLAGVTLYASLFTPKVHRLDLHDLPKSHQDGPYLLNVMRFLDTPQAVALATERSQVRIYQADKSGWEYPQAVARKLNWSEKQLQVRVPKPEQP